MRKQKIINQSSLYVISNPIEKLYYFSIGDIPKVSEVGLGVKCTYKKCAEFGQIWQFWWTANLYSEFGIGHTYSCWKSYPKENNIEYSYFLKTFPIDLDSR